MVLNKLQYQLAFAVKIKQDERGIMNNVLHLHRMAYLSSKDQKVGMGHKEH